MAERPDQLVMMSGSVESRPRARVARRAPAAGLLIGALAPWILYLVLRPHLGSATEALVIGGSIPAAWVLFRLVATRRIAWIPLASVAVFGVAVAVSIISGGSALPLKLRSSVITGAIGLACVVSVAIGRPLPVVLARLPSIRDPRQMDRVESILRDPARLRALSVVTVMFGTVLLIDAFVRAVLALSLSTSTFLAVSSVVSWTIVGAGLVPIVLYLRHRRRLSASGTPE